MPWMVYVVMWCVLGGGVGYLIGAEKGQGASGFLLGLLLGVVGWIIVAVMEPSAEVRHQRQSELALAMGVAPQVAYGETPVERACPFCAEMIKPAAIVCRYCGRDVPSWTPPPTTVPADGAPTPDYPPELERVRAAYPGVFFAVLAALKQRGPLTARDEGVMAEACQRVLQGQSPEKAVRRAIGYDGTDATG